MTNTQAKRKKTDAIIAKAMQDDDYRRELLVNPKQAIHREFGKELPPGLDVRVVEEAANVVYLVLPARPVTELSDHDLAAVAGGLVANPSMQRPINGWIPLDEWLVTVKM